MEAVEQVVVSRAALERLVRIEEAAYKAWEWIAVVDVEKMPGVGDTQSEVLALLVAAFESQTSEEANDA